MTAVSVPATASTTASEAIACVVSGTRSEPTAVGLLRAELRCVGNADTFQRFTERQMRTRSVVEVALPLCKRVWRY